MTGHFDLGREKCNCGNDTFQVVYLGSPSTPAHIVSILTKCCICGLMREIAVKEAKLLRTQES